MNNRLITDIAFIILGLPIVVGPLAIFSVYGVHGAEDSSMSGMESSGGHENIAMQPDSNSMANMEQGFGDSGSTPSMIMKCDWTAKAELGVGILIL